MGAVLLYLAIGLTFVSLFTFMGLLIPDALAGLSVKDSSTFTSTMIYFVFGTLTGAGSGDIAPLHPVARSLTVLVAMIGQLYPATLLARLVTLEIEGEAKRRLTASGRRHKIAKLAVQSLYCSIFVTDGIARLFFDCATWAAD